MQTGSDTEYALVVLALCVGVAYSFARFIFESVLLGFIAINVFASYSQKSFFRRNASFTLLLLMRRVSLLSHCVFRNLR